jgi:hypothetical protein
LLFSPAMAWFTGSLLALGVAVVIAMGVPIALGVRYLEARSRRDEEAARLQQALSESLAREPELSSSSILPIVSLPLRGGARIELTGWVASAETREVAARTIEREAARLAQAIRIVDHLEIVDGQGAMRRPA